MALFEVQPAYKIYAFDRGWRIMGYVTENLFKRTDVAARWWFDQGKSVLAWGELNGSFAKYCSYVVMAGMGIAGCVQYLTAMIMAFLFVVIQSILLLLWAGFCLLIIGILFAVTFTYSRFYRIFFRCPDCHKQMDIPTFICPTCATEHTQLWPSIYGILTHRCKTCEARLPTLSMKIASTNAVTERDSIKRICPHCHTQMNVGIGKGTNVHIPIVGGPSAGKSNYIVMAVKGFKELYESRYHYDISFTDSKHKQDYTESVRRLSSGRELMATTQVVAHAFNLKVQAPVPSWSHAQAGSYVSRLALYVASLWHVLTTGRTKLAYIYDVAGEAFNKSETTQLQDYYKYINGIIFVIDPFAIPDYKHNHQTDVARYQSQIRPSSLDIMQAYERMFQMFESSVGLRRGQRFPHPIAVVVTKVDALNLEGEIGGNAAQAMMLQDPSISEEEAIHKLVRNFLNRYGLDHFVRDVEMQFSHVRYFSCSALGRMPDPADGRSFVPIRVAEPLLWLLSYAKAIMPQAAKARTTTPAPKMTPPVQQHR